MTGAAIATTDLTKHYGKTVALEGLNLTVERGEIFGFLGPNGAGKSTTIRLLLGLVHPTRGSATVMGVPVHDVKRAHRHLGYVAGEVALWPQLTGAETLDLLGSVSGSVDTALRAELIERLGVDPSRRVGDYSKGNRQKIALVAAFMTRPDVLLLDEPTAGLDPLMELEFQRLAREAVGRGQTIFLSSHILDQVQDLCHRVGIVRDGRLVEVATLEDLRKLGAKSVFELHFEGSVPDLSAVPGVVSAQAFDGGVRVSIEGSPAALLGRLAHEHVTRLHSIEPTLEETFLAFY